MDWKYLLTSYDGRINRAKFWAASACLRRLASSASSSTRCSARRITLGGGGQLGIIDLIISLGVDLFRASPSTPSAGTTATSRAGGRLIILVPFIGGIWFIVECGILEGTKGANRYGPDPLA